MIRRINILLPLMISLLVMNAAADDAIYGIYTNIQTQEGEPSGFEIYLLNNGRPGRCDISVLFQAAEGWPQEPELLDCCGCGSGNIEFESDKWGKFKGVLSEGQIIGEFLDIKLQVKLKRGKGFWQK